MCQHFTDVCACPCGSVANKMNKSILPKISLCLIILIVCIGCKNVYSQKPSDDTVSRKLQVELRMPEPWKKIVIGPTHSIEYPNVPQRFSMFMTGESTGALKPYLLIEDSTGKEYSILLAMTTGHYTGGSVLSLKLRHADETSHNKTDPHLHP